MMRSVTIIEQGREGRVRYAGPIGSLEGYLEFGGNDVVAIVNMGSWEDRTRSHPWAVEQWAEVLRFIADEVIRQRAPACTAVIDEQRGEIILRRSGVSAPPPVPTSPTPQQKSVAFVRRYSTLKAMAGIGLLVITIIVGAVFWVGKKTLMITAVNGIPLNECVRTDQHIASLIQTTDPHAVEISGRGANTTTSVSIILIPLNGSKPQLVPVATGLNGNSLGLSRIMGSDGRTLWFDAAGLNGVRLSDHELITPKDLRAANPALDPSWWEDPRGMDLVDGRLHIMRDDRSAAIELDPASLKASPTTPKPSNRYFDRHSPADFLASGSIRTPGTWLGLLSEQELGSEYQPGKRVGPVEHANSAKVLRRLYKAEIEPATDGTHHRIRSIAPLDSTTYLNGAFVRMDVRSEPIRLNDPDGLLMLYTSAPGQQGTATVARIDDQGRILWKVDTGIDRFKLEQILPGPGSTAFVGPRPPIPGKLSEPLVVIVEHGTGKVATHSLWR
ncbi:MAG: hypothetical protein JST41_12585 [Bacteroidetes bacterium]|nr:hypothetical protein [Bacteroidota bacterium]HMU13815.1 hypothetical protein [Flavobacteriales bacterium]